MGFVWQRVVTAPSWIKIDGGPASIGQERGALKHPSRTCGKGWRGESDPILTTARKRPVPPTFVGPLGELPEDDICPEPVRISVERKLPLFAGGVPRAVPRLSPRNIQNAFGHWKIARPGAHGDYRRDPS